MRLNELKSALIGPVYHYGGFKPSDIPRSGMHWGEISAALDRGRNQSSSSIFDTIRTYRTASGWFWKDLYTKTDSRSLGVSPFGSESRARNAGIAYLQKTITGKHLDVYLSRKISTAWLALTNPMDAEDVGEHDLWDDVIEQAKAKGHDGIRYVNKHEGVGTISWIIFDPKSVKKVSRLKQLDTTSGIGDG